jgi:hypothetical protein
MHFADSSGVVIPDFRYMDESGIAIEVKSRQEFNPEFLAFQKSGHFLGSEHNPIRRRE